MAKSLRAIVLLVFTIALAGTVWRWLGGRPGDSGSAGPPRGGELIASIRSEPSSYNRYVPAGASAATSFLTLLTHARLVHVNRATDELEPWLAESWTSGDGLTYTLKLRPNIAFSDGAPLTTADVLFSFRAAYDPNLKSSLQASLLVAGKPLDVSAIDERTLVIHFPSAFAPGLRLLDNLPILPKHKLEAALDEGRFADAWSPSNPLTDIAGLGPFVLTEHVSGQRLVLRRNPHYFRRDAQGQRLPYLDRFTLVVIPDQGTEALRLQAAETDLMSNADLRPQDYAAFRRLNDAGRIRLIDAGVGVDADFLWFNLTPERQAQHSSRRWLFRREFRQAISYAVDRQAIVNGAYLGAAVPVYGPVSPRNATWHSPDAPTYPHDPGKARELLASLELLDRNGDGSLEDGKGALVRFSMLTQAGHIRGRTATMIQEHLRQVGIGVDLVAMDQRGIVDRWSRGDYDSIYFGFQTSSTDPAMNLESWMSSGSFHVWHANQPSPATDWERRIDELMVEQVSAAALADRQKAFAEVQRIMGEELPAIYFVAPRITIATSPRVAQATPAPQAPQLLWSADTLAAAPDSRPDR